MNKIKMIGLLIVTMYMLTACTYNGNIDESLQTDSSVSETSNVVTLESTSDTTQSTEVQEKSEEKQALEEYLRYFSNNKDVLLINNAEKYKIQFYQTYDSDLPEMVIETKTLPEIDNNRNYYSVYYHYFNKSADITRIDWRYESYYDDRNSSFSSQIVVDLSGNYREIIIENNNKGTFVDENKIGDNERSISLFSSYFVNSSAELRDCMDGFLLPYANEYPDDMYEQNLNPDTSKYEMYIISQEVIDSIGEVDYIEPTFNFNSYVVTKGVYENAYKKYMNQYKEVTDITKYTSDWILVEDEIDTDRILDEACAIFEE